jgi:hypothetical protein
VPKRYARVRWTSDEESEVLRTALFCARGRHDGLASEGASDERGLRASGVTQRQHCIARLFPRRTQLHAGPFLAGHVQASRRGQNRLAILLSCDDVARSPLAARGATLIVQYVSLSHNGLWVP